MGTKRYDRDLIQKALEYYENGVAIREIAEMLGINHKSLRTCIQRHRAKLIKSKQEVYTAIAAKKKDIIESLITEAEGAKEAKDDLYKIVYDEIELNKCHVILSKEVLKIATKILSHIKDRDVDEDNCDTFIDRLYKIEKILETNQKRHRLCENLDKISINDMDKDHPITKILSGMTVWGTSPSQKEENNNSV